jgi:signal peptidase I
MGFAMETEKQRKPFIAFFLSFLTPGLGQLYNGQIKRAALLYSLLFVISINPLSLKMFATFRGLVIWLVATTSLLLSIMIDARQHAIKIKKIKPTPYNRWYIYAAIIVLQAVAIQPLIKSFHHFKAYQTPTNSMQPTLIRGDYFMVDKTYYENKPPGRMDVVVFRAPEDPQKEFVKRVIGLSGDVVEIRAKNVYINGTVEKHDYVKHTDPNIISGAIAPRDNYGPVTVTDGALFVLGDNRDQSLDSRFWGFVDMSQLKGKALYIYWSQNRNRIGKKIN